MNLNLLRKKIDQLDKKIVSLLDDRTKVAIEIGKRKTKTGSEIYAPERERQVYDKLVRLNQKSPLPDKALKAIYREIMSASLSLEKSLSIAYLGPESTFTHLASISKFGSSVDYAPAQSIQGVFREVERGHADYGVIPVENSTEGAVTHSLDMFVDSNLKICSEILFEISHNLMSKSKLKSIKKVYSNPQVFGQCRQWIETYLYGVELIDTASTTAAAKQAAREKTAAAIGSKLAATTYGVPLLAEGIQDFSQNMTRFIVIAPQSPKPSGKDKTSIVVSIKDKVGALNDVLVPFKRSRINMTKIESRPSKRKAWEYYFYIDFVGHSDQPKVKKLLSEIEGKVKFMKVLGSYPTDSAKEV